MDVCDVVDPTLQCDTNPINSLLRRLSQREDTQNGSEGFPANPDFFKKMVACLRNTSSLRLITFHFLIP